MRKVWLLGKNIKIIYFNTARDNFFTDFRVLLLLSYCTVLYTIICSNKFHKIVGMKLKIHCCLCLYFPPQKYILLYSEHICQILGCYAVLSPHLPTPPLNSQAIRGPPESPWHASTLSCRSRAQIFCGVITTASNTNCNY